MSILSGAQFEFWSMARRARTATELKVRDLQSGEVTVVVYKPDAG
jgi:hypothetical protein